MELYRKILGNAKKPAGFLGHMMLAGMNLGHTGLAVWGCRFLGEEIPDQVLDIGCGGGVNVKRFLNRYADAHVAGLDYSAVSVESARKRNRAAIEEHEEHFPGARILGWGILVLGVIIFVCVFDYAGWDGIRSGFVFC